MNKSTDRKKFPEPPQQAIVGASEFAPALSHADLRTTRRDLAALCSALAILAHVPDLADGVKPTPSMRLLMSIQNIRMQLNSAWDHDTVLAEAALVGFRGAGPLKSTSASHAILETADSVLFELRRLAVGKKGRKLRRVEHSQSIAIDNSELTARFSEVASWLRSDVTAVVDLLELRSRMGCEMLRIEQRRRNPAPLLTDEEFEGAKHARLVMHVNGALKETPADILNAIAYLEEEGYPISQLGHAAIRRRAGLSLGTMKKYSTALQHFGFVTKRKDGALVLEDPGRAEVKLVRAQARLPKNPQSL